MQYLDIKNKIGVLQQKIDALGAMSAETQKKINYKFRLDWNYYSNSMEGNTLTKEETRSIMVGNITVGGKPIKDVLEIKGHDEVISTIINMGKGQVRLSETRIRDLHKSIMYEENAEQKAQIGIWKTKDNYIYNYKNERFDFTPPSKVAEEMHQLLNRTNAAIDAIEREEKDAPHPIDLALQFHLDYVTIHPFYDGNGRTARILTNLLLISFGYPPFWVKTDERDAYHRYIGDVQCYGGSPDLFFAFAASKILRSQQLILEAMEGKNIEEPDDIDKKVDMLSRLLDNLDEIKKTKDEAVMQEMLTEIVVPLFRKIAEKSLKLSPLFIKINFSLGGDNSSYGILANMEEVLEKTEKIFKLNDLNNYFGIYFNVYFEKLKKLGTKAFDESLTLHIKFSEYKYILEFPSGTKVEKLYHQLLSAEEMDNISSELINYTINNIERQIEHITKKI